MIQKCFKPNSGLTLVEVIFSLALVGTLMVTLLLAHRRNTEQLALAEKQLGAIVKLNEMMIAFYEAGQASEEALFEQATGRVPGEPKLLWRRFLRTEGTSGKRVAGILRVEVFDPSFLDGKTLADVEVITSVVNRSNLQ